MLWVAHSVDGVCVWPILTRGMMLNRNLHPRLLGRLMAAFHLGAASDDHGAILEALGCHYFFAAIRSMLPRITSRSVFICRKLDICVTFAL